MWYAANLLYKGSRNPPGPDAPLWEESIRLVWAASEREAKDKAQRLAQSEQARYRVQEAEVAWTFSCVERVYAIEGDQLTDGTELFSRFLRDSEVTSMLTPFDDE